RWAHGRGHQASAPIAGDLVGLRLKQPRHLGFDRLREKTMRAVEQHNLCSDRGQNKTPTMAGKPIKIATMFVAPRSVMRQRHGVVSYQPEVLPPGPRVLSRLFRQLFQSKLGTSRLRDSYGRGILASATPGISAGFSPFQILRTKPASEIVKIWINRVAIYPCKIQESSRVADAFWRQHELRHIAWCLHL